MLLQANYSPKLIFIKYTYLQGTTFCVDCESLEILKFFLFYTHFCTMLPLQLMEANHKIVPLFINHIPSVATPGQQNAEWRCSIPRVSIPTPNFLQCEILWNTKLVKVKLSIFLLLFLLLQLYTYSYTWCYCCRRWLWLSYRNQILKYMRRSVEASDVVYNLVYFLQFNNFS